MNKTPTTEMLFEKAHDLRRLMVGYHDFLPLLDEIIGFNDPSVIRPLLSIVDFPNLTHQMYAIIHAVESFPRDIYISELVQTIETMEACCPEFLDLVFLRLINTADDCEHLLSELVSQGLSNTIEIAARSFGRIKVEYPTVRGRCEFALQKLKPNNMDVGG